MSNPIRSEKPVRRAGWPTRPSLPGPSLWQAAQEALQRARKLDLPSVTSVRVSYDRRAALQGRYAVRIRGKQLRPGPSPLTVNVGGELLIETRFSRDGKTLTGRLLRKPRNKKVLLDYGYVTVTSRL